MSGASRAGQNAREAHNLQGDNPPITLTDAQQQRLLERLRQAGGEPVAFPDLHSGGIAFPAAVISELELNGAAIR
jgi:hypothetical protein